MVFRKHQPFQLREFAYPSNILSVLRLLLLPLALWSMRRPEDRRLAFGLIGFAMFTDAIDGPIARHRNEVSELGKLLDPIADKLMLDGAALMLSRYRGFPAWIAAALLLRDIVILSGGMRIYQEKTTIVSAQPMGKLTTVVLTAAMLLYLADGPRTGKPALYLAMLPFGASMVAYIRSYNEHMRS